MRYTVKVSPWCVIHCTSLADVVDLVARFTGCVVTVRRKGAQS